MKKTILTVVVLVIGFVSFAQQGLTKYETTAPDGTIAMTLVDNLSEKSLNLESAFEFYKYEILDLKTSEAVYSSENEGKKCNIDKTKIASGTYNLRLYTPNFIITTRVPIGTTKDGSSLLKAYADSVVG